jgi:hypothetical protein
LRCAALVGLGSLALLLLLVSADRVEAAGAPAIIATWAASASVSASAATPHAQIDPEEVATTYHFGYLTQAAFEANGAAGREAFAGATRVPLPDGSAGAADTSEKVFRLLQGLVPDGLPL